MLTARVDLLAPQDRALLQAAAVTGRRFEPQLLAVAADGGGDIDARLSAMEALPTKGAGQAKADVVEEDEQNIRRVGRKMVRLTAPDVDRFLQRRPVVLAPRSSVSSTGQSSHILCGHRGKRQN